MKEAAYDAKITDIENQDVKSLSNFIHNICGITTSINADKFKIELSKYVREGMNVYQELESCIFQKP